MSRLGELAQQGQSIWYDYIRRAFIRSGELQSLLDQGVRGVTSNPTIFEKAIGGSADYDEALRALATAGNSAEQIYDQLSREDIAEAADLLAPVYRESEGVDGYVSLEVSPTLAHDTSGTVDEARRLFKTIDKPNVMIKVPATSAGIDALRTLIGEGINVNVTLIFSVDHYLATANSYVEGLEHLAANGGDLSRVASVASFFVSRVDTAVDKALKETGKGESLLGRIAIANAKVAYGHFEKLLASDRWQNLQTRGARPQRLLWASTGTKNPLYPDTLYVDELIGPYTVNTAPPATVTAFCDHGTVAPTLTQGLEEAQDQLRQLQELGIDVGKITENLQEAGVASFAKSFETLMASIQDKKETLSTGRASLVARPGPHVEAYEQALQHLRADRVMGRIWDGDHTVWKPEPAEIANRLGWLHTADQMLEQVPTFEDLADNLQRDGYTHALLLGMGGSSLAPEVFRETFGVKQRFLDLAVLDSTDPGAVRAQKQRLDPKRTLFVVSTKSGGTVETLSFFKTFYNWVADAVGRKEAGRHFVAITDPGSKLVELAQTYEFRSTFLNDPNIGGRYSALSMFGLIPAALMGVDLRLLLDRALTAACNSEGANCPKGGDNTGARLGAMLGRLALEGRNKLTLLVSPPIASFGAWVEQLIAESTGKDGKGIVPVDGESVGPPEAYGEDRLFAYIKLEGDTAFDAPVQKLLATSRPVVQLNLRDRYDIGAEFFRWEMATAVAGHFLGIQPFDQPNVEAAKILARRMVDAYHQQGSLPTAEPTLESEGIRVYAPKSAPDLATALGDFLGQSRVGDYVALHAYLQPTDETTQALDRWRTQLRDQFRLATTLGYGPRFLHSTGQLYKGDSGQGLFIQVTADDPHDEPIPDTAGSEASSMSFGVLKAAQAMGDQKAMEEAGRRVIRFHLRGDVVAGIERLRRATS